MTSKNRKKSSFELKHINSKRAKQARTINVDTNTNSGDHENFKSQVS